MSGSGPPVVDVAPLGGAFLRGYPPGTFVGNQFHLLNVEYRLPLLSIFLADTGRLVPESDRLHRRRRRRLVSRGRRGGLFGGSGPRWRGRGRRKRP